MSANNLWSRVHHLLAPSPAECKADKDLSRFVPSEIARQVTSLEHRIEPGQCPMCAVREATILFTDIEGFTAIGESLSPEQFERLGVVPVRGRQSPVTIYTLPAP